MGKRMFERKVYGEMLKWKKEYAPRYALFLKGPRRVGKTTLAEKLGKENYKSYLLIRFDNAPEVIKNLFVNSLLDLDHLYNTLQTFYRTPLYRRESLIILDEIQLFPLARQALKTLLEDARYDFLETGSLAGITKKGANILIPSEEYKLDVLPMDFEEFLQALGDQTTFPAIQKQFSTLKNDPSIHSFLMRSFREYMLVGGMPQAVEAYIKNKDYAESDFAKRNILSTYSDDMSNQKEENPKFVGDFFEHIPSELSRHDKRYVLSDLSKNARLRDYGGPINWLNDAMIVNLSLAVSDPCVAFNLSLIEPTFKCYLMDTGLLVTLAYRNGPFLENTIYREMLLDRLHVNEGMILENAVAQCLRSNGHHAYYYKKVDEISKKTTMEIDFLIRKDDKVIPIEVKSGESKAISSLLKFKKTFSKKIGQLIVLHDGIIKQEDTVLYLPYYMACLL